MAGFSNVDLKSIANANFLPGGLISFTFAGTAKDIVPPTTTIISPGAGNINTTTPLVFNVVDNVSQAALASLIVTITFPISGIKEVVHDGITFGPKYQLAATKSSITKGYQFSIVRDGGWIAGDGPTLNVYACDNDGNITPFAYSSWVTVVDNTPPVLYSLISVTATLVKVIYSEAVNTSDALTVGNYSLNNGLVALSVSQVSPSIYLLTTTAQTPSTVYTLTVSNVRDLYGNVI